MADGTPTFTAELLGINPLTLRRWCDYHAAYLSSGCNPPTGQARRFTDKDIEILKHVKHLRSQGFSTTIINEQLAGLTFAEIEQSDQPDDEPSLDIAIAPQNVSDALQASPAILMTLEAMRSEIASIRAVASEAKQGQKDAIQWFAFGFIAAGIFFLIIIVAAWLYGGA